MKKLSLAFLLSCALLMGTLHVNADEETTGSITESNPNNTVISQKDEIINSTWGSSPVEFNKSSGQLTVKKGEISNYTYITKYVDEEKKIDKKDVKSVLFENGVEVPSYGRHLFSAVNNWIQLESVTGDLDTSKVTDMSNMFCNPALLTIDLSSFNTSNVTNMQWMFQSSKVSQLNLKSFDTKNVTDMDSMFMDMPNLTNLDLSNFNTSKVTRMGMMFDTIPNLSSLDVSNFDTTQVNNMSFMFRRDSGIKNLDLTSFNTSKVLDMEQMFAAMTNLNTLNISSFDTSIGSSTSGIFLQDYNLSSLSLRDKFKFGNSSDLPEIDQTSGVYSGKWEKNNPVAPPSIYDSSKSFMQQYDGSLPGIYTWQKKQSEIESHVTVNYQDEKGNKLIDSIILKGHVNDSYSTEKKLFDGYTFKEIVGNYQGLFTEKDQTVTYVYIKNIEPVAKGTVVVKYIDDEKNTLLNSITLTGNIGTSYSTEEKLIAGYTFKEVKGNRLGKFSDQDQTVTYVYSKDTIDPIVGGDVIAKYVDTKGHNISVSERMSGNIGEDYRTKQKDIVGYILKEVKGSRSGKFLNQVQTIIYVYKKDKSNNINGSPKSNNKLNHEVNSNKVSSWTNQKYLPKTGGDEKINIVYTSLGLLLLITSVCSSFFFFKR